MKSVLLGFVVVVSILSVTPSFAGKGHKHAADGSHLPMKELTGDEAKTSASKEVQRLIEKGKLGKNWQDATVVSTEKKSIKGQWEWLVTYKNVSEPETSKQTLYVFLTPNGGFIAANFTGK